MAGLPGAKCPSCGAIAKGAPERPKEAVVEPRAEPPEMPASAPEARAGVRPMPTPIQKAALGLTLVIYAVATYLLSLFATMASPDLGTLVGFVAFALALGGMVLMGLGLQFTGVGMMLAVVATFIPLVNIVAVLVVASRAMQALKAAGYRIGFMGAKPPAS
jgi:hypothetical protein